MTYKTIWAVYANTSNKPDSLWADEAGANAAAAERNDESKRVYNGQYIYTVWPELLRSSDTSPHE